MHSEAIDPRLVSALRLLWLECWIDLEEDVVKRRAKVCAIYAVMPGRFRIVDVLTLGTVELHVGCVGNIVLTHGQEMLRFAYHTRALAKDSLLEFLHLIRRVSGKAGRRKRQVSFELRIT